MAERGKQRKKNRYSVQPDMEKSQSSEAAVRFTQRDHTEFQSGSTIAQAATSKRSETCDVGLEVLDADRTRMQDRNQEVVTPTRDLSTAVQDASCLRVTIYCPACFLAKDVDINQFWQTNG